MAGLGESFTHIAAILFWTEIKVNFISSRAVTGSEFYWLAPKQYLNLPTQLIPRECTEEEKLPFFKSLADSNNPAGILRVLPKYFENFIPHTLTSSDVPVVRTEVFNEKYTKLNYG